jgi:hypothetical protein
MTENCTVEDSSLPLNEIKSESDLISSTTNEPSDDSSLNEIKNNLSQEKINEEIEDQVVKQEDMEIGEKNGLSLDPERAFIKLSSFSIKEFRSIKTQIEEALLNKIKKMEDVQLKHEEKYVCYFKDFAVDKIGNSVSLGETGIAEGWSVPMYENEFRNLLGLPFTENNAAIRVKKPQQECFNCLSTNHGVRECPVRVNQERLDFHKKIFNTQSAAAQDQAYLFSSRYTSELESKLNKGFVVGKISDELKEALGCKSNQLPPYVYIMRKYGYPKAWLLEAQVTNCKLSVIDGGLKTTDDHDGDEATDEMKDLATADSQADIEYDPDRIFTFPGFNEPPESGMLDESHIYGAKRYGSEFSREMLLSTLKLQNKIKKVVKRTISKLEEPSEDSNTEKKTDDTIESLNENDSIKDASNETIELDEEDEDDEKGDECDLASSTTKKQKITSKKSSSRSQSKTSMLGTSFNAIPGTPIVNNSFGGILKLPEGINFSENICAHKPFEMNSNTPTGSYQKIQKITKELKTKPTTNEQEITKDF